MEFRDTKYQVCANKECGATVRKGLTYCPRCGTLLPGQAEKAVISKQELGKLVPSKELVNEDIPTKEVVGEESTPTKEMVDEESRPTKEVAKKILSNYCGFCGHHFDNQIDKYCHICGGKREEI